MKDSCLCNIDTLNIYYHILHFIYGYHKNTCKWCLVQFYRTNSGSASLTYNIVQHRRALLVCRLCNHAAKFGTLEWYRLDGRTRSRVDTSVDSQLSRLTVLSKQVRVQINNHRYKSKIENDTENHDNITTFHKCARRYTCIKAQRGVLVLCLTLL